MSRGDREGFERFYREVREDLLLQTLALTGDLAAAEKAVHDALVIAWHHWRKVSQLDDPAGWVRPLAWSRAQRRHTARWWHWPRRRQRERPSDQRATLDALTGLDVTQRKVLLLTVLTAQPLAAIAREVGLSQSATERELQAATTRLSLERDVPSAAVRGLITSLRSQTTAVRWPRPSILLRAGTARRRSHTTFGIAAIAATTVLTGSLVADADGISPDLASKVISSFPTPVAPGPAAPPDPPDPPAPTLSEDALLGADQLAAEMPGTWDAGAVTRNTEGDGLNITCQQARFADPLGLESFVRTYSAPVAGGPAAAPTGRRVAAPVVRTAVQSLEASTTPEAAAAAYDVQRSWYAACDAPRLQLISTYEVTGLGDTAGLVVLRSRAQPASTMVVGVARTGTLTTTVATTTPGAQGVPLPRAQGLLADAVARLCTAPGGATCVADPRVDEVASAPLEEAPAMIGELDLPPVGDVVGPWAGTAPTPATTNDAATPCDNADFSGAPFVDARTRSFLIPDATRLPPEFGLTETVGALPARRAQRFVDTIRERLQTCPDRELGTQVETIVERDTTRTSVTAWTVQVEIEEGRFVGYRMAVLRSGTAVAQLGFIAGPDADLSDESFIALADRALQRLGELPPPA